jgi:hypothetical protein
MPSTITDAFEAVGLDPAGVDRIVSMALEEDLGGADGVDVTSVATIPADQMDAADVVARARRRRRRVFPRRQPDPGGHPSRRRFAGQTR